MNKNKNKYVWLLALAALMLVAAMLACDAPAPTPAPAPTVAPNVAPTEVPKTAEEVANEFFAAVQQNNCTVKGLWVSDRITEAGIKLNGEQDELMQPKDDKWTVFVCDHEWGTQPAEGTLVSVELYVTVDDQWFHSDLSDISEDRFRIIPESPGEVAERFFELIRPNGCVIYWTWLDRTEQVKLLVNGQVHDYAAKQELADGSGMDVCDHSWILDESGNSTAPAPGGTVLVEAEVMIGGVWYGLFEVEKLDSLYFY